MRPESVPQPDDLVYRNHLVAVLTAATTVTGTEFGPPPAPENAPWLDRHFKQSFTTTDNTAIGANVVACEVLTRALVEDLGLAATAVPARRTSSPRVHLNALIAASGNTLAQLEGVYCIDLHRSDLAETTRIRENIATLQRYLTDGPIPDRHRDFLPFFLYKDEWRLQQHTPFHPENHRRLLEGSFTTTDDRRRAEQLLATAGSFEYAPDPSKPNQKVRLAADQRFEGFRSRLGDLLVVDTALTEAHRFLVEQEYRLAEDGYRDVLRRIDAIAERIAYPIWTTNAAGTSVMDRRCVPDLGRADRFAASLDPTDGYDYVFYGTNPTTHLPEAQWQQVWLASKDSGVWPRIDVAAGLLPAQVPFTMHLFTELARRYGQRVNAPVRSLTELRAMEALTTVTVPDRELDKLGVEELWEAVTDLHDELLALLPHEYCFTVPICLGASALAVGDHPTAAKRYASIARESLLRATIETPTPCTGAENSAPDGDLPWTWDPGHTAGVGQDYPYANLACDRALLQLKVGELYLAWADDLYRTDEYTSVARARTLYRAVLHLYGVQPDPAPKLSPLPLRMRPSVRTTLWQDSRIAMRALVPGAASGDHAVPIAPTGGGGIPGPAGTFQGMIVALAQPLPVVGDLAGLIGYVALLGNPAMLAQQRRATLALEQIAAGTNVFGYRDDLVPLLRYRPLAAAAQHYATSAAQAEDDAIRFGSEASRTELGLITARTAVGTAALRVAVESERIVQADDARRVAEVQVTKVEDAIAAKRAEIADHNGICGQIGDWFKGLTSFFGNVPSAVGSYVGSDASASIGLSTPAAGATAGLGVVGGMALWAVGTAVTLSGMADAANARGAALQQLEQQDLFAANAALDARRRELAIAQGQKVIAELEARTAEEIYRYSVLQFLGHDLWTQLAATMHAVLRRFLELGAMTGWLAERALAYEQDRDIRVMRLDYYDEARKGLLGSARLRRDLDLLEAEYLTGVRARVPLTWTVSLAQRFPLAFGALHASGRCTVQLDSNDLRRMYPGSHSHRVRAVEVLAVQSVADPPPRGVLTNTGISRIVGPDGTSHDLVRPADTFPLSEFRFDSDHLALYQLPDGGLLPFEGSGIDTAWTIELPAEANPTGFGRLLDLCLRFHLDTQFTEAEVVDQHRSPVCRRIALLSAKELFAPAWAAFRTGPHELTFDLTEAHLLPGTQRTVTNVGVFLLGVHGATVPDVAATLTVAGRQPLPCTIRCGLAHSTQVPGPATVPGAGTAQLDALFDRRPLDPLGAWHVRLQDDRAPIEVDDVWLAVEYASH